MDHPDTARPHRPSRSSSARSTRPLALGLAVLMLLGTGCSGSGEEPDAESTSSASPSDAGSASPTDGGESGDEGGDPDQEPTSTQAFTDMGEDFRGILSDVTVEDCPTTRGEVEARGTIENTADEAQDLFVGVIWLKPDSGDSVALGEWTATDVGAGETVDWSVKADLPSKPGQCVLQAKANAVGTLE